MNHAETTRKIDRRLGRRKPEVNERYFARWERQWDNRYGRSKPTYAATMFDRDHERLMRTAVAGTRARD